MIPRRRRRGSPTRLPLPPDVKICGLNSVEAVEASVAGGAKYIGFNFYPPSPRSLSPEQAADLTLRVPTAITRVGLFVNPRNETLDQVLSHATLDWIQLHGDETPERTAEIRRFAGRPVMKAIKVSTMEQIDNAKDYLESVDWLLFDAKAPDDMPNALPGGNALAFDWTLLSDTDLQIPWMLAGGLDADNIATAVQQSGARVIDVSSGVEDRPGVKNPDKISAFLAAARMLD